MPVLSMFHQSLPQPQLVSSITIVSDAPNCGVTYEHHNDAHNSFIIQATSCIQIYSFKSMGRALKYVNSYWNAKTGKPNLRRRLSTVDLLVLTCQISSFFYIGNIIYIFNKTGYLNEEVNHTEPLPSVSIPWPKLPFTQRHLVVEVLVYV